jgi:hypothetical protein
MPFASRDIEACIVALGLGKLHHVPGFLDIQSLIHIRPLTPFHPLLWLLAARHTALCS